MEEAIQHVFKEDVFKEVRSFVFLKMTDGAKYISERSIAERFNLKRGSSRDILLTLEGEGILERVPQKGYRLVDYEQTDFPTILAIRFALEREAARKAMVKMTREDILRMTLAFEDMERLAKENNAEEFRRADIAFHKAIIMASHDNMLKNMFEFISFPVFRMKIPIRERLITTNEAHLEILTTMKERDWPTMENLLRNHLGQAGRKEDAPVDSGIPEVFNGKHKSKR